MRLYSYVNPRRLDLRTFDELQTEVSRLSKHPYRRVGHWSLGQNCHHLAKMFNQSIDGFDVQLPRFIRLFSRWMKNWLLKRRSIPRGIKAPKSFLPDDQINDVEGVLELMTAIRRYRDHNGPLQPSPVFGRLSREEWDQLHLIHASHHLGFILPMDSPISVENRAID